MCVIGFAKRYFYSTLPAATLWSSSCILTVCLLIRCSTNTLLCAHRKHTIDIGSGHLDVPTLKSPEERYRTSWTSVLLYRKGGSLRYVLHDLLELSPSMSYSFGPCSYDCKPPGTKLHSLIVHQLPWLQQYPALSDLLAFFRAE